MTFDRGDGAVAPAGSLVLETATRRGHRVRKLLLGSTALIGVTLAAPAMAQSINPAGGGTISGSGTYANDTAGGGGVSVDATNTITMNGVTIGNGTGTPTPDAFHMVATSGSAIFVNQGANALTTTVNGGAALYVRSDSANLSWGVSQTDAGSVMDFTGSYGLYLEAPAGFINVVDFATTTGIRNITANGTALEGIHAIASGGVNLSLKAPVISGFATGIRAAGSGTSITTTGGSISAATGIDSQATSGNLTLAIASNITAQDAVLAAATGGTVTVTTSGTIDSQTDGVGTGIAAAGDAGTKITVNGNLGLGGYFDTGIDAAAGAGGNTIDVNAHVRGNTGISTGGGAFVTTVGVGGEINAMSTMGRAIRDSGGGSIINNGNIWAAGTAIELLAGGSVTNNSTLTGNSGTAIYFSGGGGSVTLASGSMTTGSILASGSAAVTATIAGTLAGGYLGAVDNRVDTVTLAANGTITGSVLLGDGNDSFTMTGGAIAGTVDGGSGTDSFVSDLGTGVWRSVTANAFETLEHRSGTLQLDGGTILTSVTISGGTLALAGNSSIAGATTVINGTLDLAPHSGTNTLGLFSGSGSILLGANTLVSSGGASIFAGSITGSGGFTRSGSGTLELTGTGNWTGTTTISSGTLSGTASSISGSSIVNNSGSFALTYTDTVAGVVTQAISGSGGINITGTGALTFTGNITTASSVVLNNFNSNVAIAGTRSGGTTVAVSMAGMLGVADTGAILGGNYIAVAALNSSTVNNLGTISTTGTSGTGQGLGSAMRFQNLAVVVNGSESDSSSYITGVTNGIYSNTGSTFFGLTATNYGVIAATLGTGITAASNPLTLTNNAGGIVAGTQYGVSVSTGTATITNSGIIGTGTVSGNSFTAGGTNDAISIAAGGRITNSGVIDGAGHGISLAGGSSNAVVNRGTILGRGGNGVYNVVNAAIVNAQGATVQGNLDGAVRIGGSATTTTYNAGTLTGDYGFLSISTGATTIHNYGSASGSLSGIRATNTGAVNAYLYAGSTTGAIALGGANDSLTIYTGTGTSDTGFNYSTASGTVGSGATDDATHVRLQSAGTLAAAVTGTINLGGGTNTVSLRGTGDGTAANGAIGSLSLAGLTGASSITKLDSGTWRLTGATASPGAAINVNGGLLTFDNTSGLTGGIFLNGGSIRALGSGAFGTGTIHAIDPTIQFGASGVYANAISLEVAAPATNDPTTLSADAGVVATLTGQIFRGAGDTSQPLVIAGAGRIVLANSTNNWTGATTINAGATLQGATNTISGASIVNNGTLVFAQGITGIFTAGISGSGALTVDSAGFTVRLAGTNSYTGVTTVAAGTLALSNGSAIADSGDVVVNSGATFQVNGSETVGSIAGAGSVSLSGLLTVAGSADTEFSGTVSGGGGIVRTGTGTLTLSGINSFSAAASILGGTLAVRNGAAVLDTGTVDVGGSGTFSVLNSETIGTLTGSGATTVAAGQTLTLASGSGTYTGNIGGNGAAVLAGGAWTYGGTSSASGGLSLTGNAVLVLTGTVTGGGVGIGGTGSATLNTQQGSSINGVVSSGSGGRWVYVGGALGGYDASAGTGVDFFNLQSTGSVTGNVDLGGGNDSFVWGGGSLAGTVSGGAGTDTFRSSLTGSGTLSLSTLSNFESYSAQAGDLTLTGTRNGGARWSVDGGTLTLGANAQLTGIAGDAIALNAADGTLTLGSGAVLGASSGFAVRTYQAGATITNDGTIAGSGAYLTDAIYANADLTLINNGAIRGIVGATDTPRTEGIYVNGTLTLANNGGAEITGGWVGVRGLGGGTITNAGTLSGNVFAGAELTGTFTVTNNNGGMIRGNGGSGSGLLLDGGTITVTNNAGGTILGEGMGGVYTRFGGATAITNAGTIEGTGTAWGIRSEINGLLTIGNSGTITGVGTAIYATGQTSITNSGTINGTVVLGAGNDTVALTGGTVNGAIQLGGGDDTLTWNGGTIGAVDGGAGSNDHFNIGTVAGTIDLANIAGFEYHQLQSGSLTLTGTQTGQAGWTLATGTTLDIGAAGQAANWTTDGDTMFVSGTNAIVNATADAAVWSSNGSVIGGTGDGTTVRNAGALNAASQSAVYLQGAGARVENSGTITGPTASGGFQAAVRVTGVNAMVENQSGGQITGQRGIDLDGPGASVTNAGTITATYDNGISLGQGGTAVNSGLIDAQGTSGAWGIYVGGDSGDVRNSGTILAGSGIWLQATGAAHQVENLGTISGDEFGVNALQGTLQLTNSGNITADLYVGVLLGEGGSVTNSGTIAGGNDAIQGYGVVTNGNATITNLAGGYISGGAGAMWLNGGGTIAVDLRAGSTVVGTVQVAGPGTRNIDIAGTLNGVYDASGATGVDNLVLRGGGMLGAADLGDGDDSFAYYGGTITGTVDGGLGTDTLFADFGLGGSGTVALGHFVNFDAFGLLSGDLTLTGPSGTPGAAIYAGNGAPAGTIVFDNTADLTGDIYVNGGSIRANTAGGFGSGTIHMIDPTATFGASGTYANAISLEVAAPATGDPSTLIAENGVVATLTGVITQGTGAGVDPAQPLVIGGLGTIVLANAANSWAGTTTVNTGATLQGTSNSISGSAIVADGTLAYVQPGSGTVAQDISGAGVVTVSGLAAGETLTFAGNNSITDGVQLLDGSAVVNTGTLTRVQLTNGGSFLNSGTLTDSAVNYGAAAASITNAGTIAGPVANGGTGTLTLANQAGASIAVSGTIAIVGGGAIALDNAGDVAGTIGAFTSTNAGSSVVNSGRMVSGTIGGASYSVAAGTTAISLGNGGTVDNRAGGLIAGGNTAIEAGGALTLTNAAGGTIEGLNAVNAYNAAANIANAGTIRSTDSDYAIGLGAGGTVVNSGTIQGGSGAFTGWGINSTGALTFVNQAGGTIGGARGAILSFGPLNADLQAGSITNGTIQLVSSATSIVNVAGSFTGMIALGTGSDVLTLDSGATIGAGSMLNGGSGNDDLILAGTGNNVLAVNTVSSFESRTMNGTGVWTLTGTENANTGWQINSGTLAASGGAAIGDGATVTIASAGTFQLASSERIGGLAGTGTVQLGANTLTLAGTSSFGGAIAGTGNLSVLNGANLTLSGANNYTGLTAVAGRLTLGASGTLADGSSLYVQASGTLDLQGFSETVASAELGGTVNGTGTLTAATTVLFGGTVNTNLAGTTLLHNGGSTTLNGTASQANVTLSGGTLTLGASDRLADTALLVTAAGTTLNLGANNETVGLASLGGTLSGTGTLTASQYGLAGATVNANLGAGTLAQLSGVSVLSGTAGADTVLVNGGTLALGASNRLADNAALAVASGATLDLGAFTDSVGTAVIAGTLAGTGTLTANIVQLDGATVNADLGVGTLVNHSGTSVLTGAHGGANVAVDAGTLRLGAAERLADTATLTVASGATFDLAGSNETVALAALAGTLGDSGIGTAPATLTAGEYQLRGATLNANLGAGNLFQLSGTSVLNAGAGAALVRVQGGTLALGGANLLSDTSTLGVDAGATLDLGANADTVGLLALAGKLDGTGTLTAAEYQLSGATVNADLGTGNLFQLAGISVLNGAVGAGSLQVQAGTLRLGAAERLANDATLAVLSGATFDLAGSSETVGIAAINGTLADNGVGTAPATLTASQYQLTGATVNGGLGAGTLFQLGGTTTLNGVAAAGAVQVQAGTLALGAANRLADNATVIVSSGATLDLGANSDTVGGVALAGTLKGTGTLTAVQYQLTGAAVNANLGDGSLFNLGGTSTLTGASGATLVAVQAGTLRLAAAERLANGATLSIDSGATFDLASFNETIGALASGAGTLALGAGRLTLAGNADSGFSGAITGTGGIDKQGSGRLTLGGNFALTGGVDVSAGTLAFLGATKGAMRVQGGTLMGAGSITGALTITSGSFAPGGMATGTFGAIDPIGSFGAGSLAVSGGSLLFDFGGSNFGFAADSVQVAGTATLTGGTVQVNALSSTSQYRFNQLYVLVQAASVSGTFANGASFADVANNHDLKWRLRYDLMPNAVVLQVQKAIDFTAGVPAGDANSVAVANALMGGAGAASDEWSATLNTIATLTPAQRLESYASMSGEAIADVGTTTMAANGMFSDLLRQRVGDGDDGLIGAGFTQMSLADVRATTTAGNSTASRLAGANVAGGGEGGAIWAQGYGGYQRLLGGASRADVESTTAGVAMGIEGRYDGFTGGIAGGLAQIDSDVDQRSSSISGTQYQLGAYLSYDGGGAFASLAASYYAGDFDTRRTILLGLVPSLATGDMHAQGYSFGGTAGYRFELGGGMRAALIASATQTHDKRDAFTERAGGGLSLDVAEAKRDLFTATGEIRLGQRIKTGSGHAMPYVTAGIRYNAGDLDTIGNMRFSGAPTGTGAFQVEGARMSPVLATWGAGIDVEASENVRLGVALDAAYGDRTREGRASMRIKIGF